jgi:hypothetical protein
VDRDIGAKQTESFELVQVDTSSSMAIGQTAGCCNFDWLSTQIASDRRPPLKLMMGFPLGLKLLKTRTLGVWMCDPSGKTGRECGCWLRIIDHRVALAMCNHDLQVILRLKFIAPARLLPHLECL